MASVMYTLVILLIAISTRAASLSDVETTDLPEPIQAESDVYYIAPLDDQEARMGQSNISATGKGKNRRRKNSTLSEAIRLASLQGFDAMIDLYERKEPEILRKGQTINEFLRATSELNLRRRVFR
jgi:hypothetical protein